MWYFGYLQDGFIELYQMLPEGVPYIKGKPGKFTSYAPLPLSTREIPDSPESLLTNNAQGYSIYFGTTPSVTRIEPVQKINKDTGKPYTSYPRRHASDIQWLPALWCDIDTMTPEVTIAALSAFRYPPGVIALSGGGVHAYWKLANPLRVTEDNRKIIRDALHGIALAVDGDVKCRDLARIMRLPGTVNTKPERNKALCHITHVNRGMTTFDMLHEQFHPFIPRQLPTPERPLVRTGKSDNLEPVTRAYLNNPPDKGNRNQMLYAAARGCNDSGMSMSEAESTLMATALSTGLDENEVRTAIASAYRAPRGAGTSLHTLRMATRDRQLRHGGLS